jgi:hypothetical protein
MILLQIDSTLNSGIQTTFGNDVWFNLEIIIIVAIIIIQLITFIKVKRRIKTLRQIFDYPLTVINGFIEKEKLGQIENYSNEILFEDNSENESLSDIVGKNFIKLSLVESKRGNKIITRIKNSINIYLINNYGAVVNFSIIKDIIDREVEVKDEEITQTITIPLYLGLAATMVGIILGLFSMPDLNGDGFSDGVNALIDGVKLAMIASLSGLFFTILLSSIFYKNAKSIVLEGMSEQLSFLQAKLLPELIKAEDTGVSGLKASLDRFARVATTISDNVLIAANQTGENLVLQQEVMEKVENMKVLKVSKWNLELFEKLDKNMDAFNKFSVYLSNMETISSNLLEFAARTSNIDHIIEGIDTTLNDSKQLTQFLSAHFDKIEDAGNAALKSVGIAESHFEGAIESLKTRTDEMIDQLYKNAGNHEAKLEEIYAEIKVNLNNITSEYIKSFSAAYANSVPKFEQLDNLKVLPELKEEYLSKTQTLIEFAKDLDVSVKSVQNNLNNQTILNKLESIDENLKKRTNKRKPSGRSNNPSVQDDREEKPLSIGKVIKELF